MTTPNPTPTDNTSASTCSGCFPEYQPNQLAHTEPGGCLWCDNEDASSQELSEVFPFLDEETTFSWGTDDTMATEAEAAPSSVHECCICYDTIDSQKNNCVTECGHRFCFKCLATAMVHNTACPCCRSPLVNSDADEEEDDDDDDDDEEDLDSEEEDEYEEDEETNVCDAEEVTRRLVAQGFTMHQLVSIMLGRYPKEQPEADIFAMNKRFDDILEEADLEILENEAMSSEDVRLVCV